MSEQPEQLSADDLAMWRAVQKQIEATEHIFGFVRGVLVDKHKLSPGDTLTPEGHIVRGTPPASKAD